MALESDEAIFKAVLAPLIRPGRCETMDESEAVTNLNDIDGEDVVVERIVKKSRFR